MIKRYRWEILISLFLVFLTVLFGWGHFLIFRDWQGLFSNLLENLVFLPIQILLVSLVIEGFLNRREKQLVLNKLNFVIEVFFSEVGVTLLEQLSAFNGQFALFQRYYAGIGAWSDKEYRRYQQMVQSVALDIDCRHGDLELLRASLMNKRDFLLRMLENPNLMEHESFTDLLWAVFHLTEELFHRKSCDELGEADRSHFANDIKRAYYLLIFEWLGYMRHLKANYPYLYSLALRLNPFNPEAEAEIRD